MPPLLLQLQHPIDQVGTNPREFSSLTISQFPHRSSTPTQQPKSSSTQRKKSFNKNSSPNLSQSLNLSTDHWFLDCQEPPGEKTTLLQITVSISSMQIRRKFLQNRNSPLSKQLNSTLAISAIPIWCRFLQNWHRLFPKKIEKIKIYERRRWKQKCNLTTTDVSKELKRGVVGRPKNFDKDFKINQRRFLQNWRSPLSKQLNTIYIYERRRCKKKRKKESNLMTTSVSKEPKRWDEFQAKEGAQSLLLWAQWTCKQKLQMVGG